MAARLPMAARGFLALFALGVAFVAFFAPRCEARVRFIPVLTHAEAVKIVAATGGTLGECKRLAPRHLRCRATYLLERHEGEIQEDGTVVEVSAEQFSEEFQVDVGFKGVRIGPAIH